MKPEATAKAPAMSAPEEFTALGIPTEWIKK